MAPTTIWRVASSSHTVSKCVLNFYTIRVYMLGICYAMYSTPCSTEVLGRDGQGFTDIPHLQTRTHTHTSKQNVPCGVVNGRANEADAIDTRLMNV